MTLTLVVLTFVGCADAGEPAVVAVGSPAPRFRLRALDGRTVESGSLKGRPVVLNFWATWCAPCLQEIPELKGLAAGGSAQVVGVALDEGGPDAVRRFVEQHGINYTVLLGDEETFTRFDGVGIPYTLLLDSSQRVVKIYRGTTTREALERDLKAAGRGD
ncbi:MAG TPA: TlpA disulfide reductase family protein [Pyrinomonadaceae bacterium]|nr:TlpA disulfide reductase family protein [Pyrinomonadaceae bacterium]